MEDVKLSSPGENHVNEFGVLRVLEKHRISSSALKFHAFRGEKDILSRDCKSLIEKRLN